MSRPPMGIVYATVTVFSPDFSRSEKVSLLVDTGSTLTWIPEEIALRAGIQATGTAEFRTADDRTVERPIADGPIECEGVRGIVRLGFEVDPVRRVLRRVDRYLALASLP